MARLTRRLLRPSSWSAGVVLLSAITVVLATAGVTGRVVGVLAILQAGVLLWRGSDWPVGSTTAVGLVTVLSCVAGLYAEGAATIWVGLAAGVAVVVGAAELPLQQRVVPRVRAVGLPGVPSDTRPREPGVLAPIVPGAAVLLALLLIAESVGDIPGVTGLAVLVLLLAAMVLCGARLRSAVRSRRRGDVDREVTGALEQYAPQFAVYFSGSVDTDYQVRMWLPYLEQLGARFIVLVRNQEMLPRAAALTDVPVVACPRVTGLDACMVPSIRVVFYVNTHGDCADGVRYIDRTHVQLNHGDSDKPSSYHPVFAMFDRVFVAGQAAVDRFARHGVSMPADRFVLVGRPQVAAVTEHNTDPVPGRRTVLYAPTWQSGMREMSLSSLEDGERIVRALLAGGARVVFRPHPLSYGVLRAVRAIGRIDEMLQLASTADCPHLTSEQARAESIVDNFNRSDAAVSDISSVASDYLASCKPLALAIPRGAQRLADMTEYPTLRAAYALELDGDLEGGLAALLGDDDVLLDERRDLRSYFLGEHQESVRIFHDAAKAVLDC